MAGPATRRRIRTLKARVKDAERRAAALARRAEYLEMQGAAAAPADAGKPKKSGQLAESLAYGVDYLSPLLDRVAEFQKYPDFYPPFSNVSDHVWGANWPFWRTEPELSFLRTLSRVVCTTNGNAIGLLNGLTGYTIGEGMQTRVTTRDKAVPDWVVSKTQDVVDEFIERSLWYELQQELFAESVKDGEYFLRHFFRDDGTVVVRRVWPEQVQQPTGSDAQEWSFGVLCEPSDIETVKAYWVADLSLTGEGEEVPASEMIHVKRNVARAVKRGHPDFAFNTRDDLENARKLRRNLGVGAAVQAAIAIVEEYTAADVSAVRDIRGDRRDFIDPRLSQYGDRDSDIEHYEAGTVHRVGKNRKYVDPPSTASGAQHVEICNLLYRSAAVRFNAPEWLSSADASSTNYASSLTAESPFVVTGKARQARYARRFRQTVEAVIAWAVECGKLPGDALYCEAQVEPPSMVVRDPQQEVQRLTAEVQAGFTSRQTASQELGRDWEQEQTNIAAEKEASSEGGGDPFGEAFEAAEPCCDGCDDGGPCDGDRSLAEGFTGEKKDKAGRRICYENGKRVKCGDLDNSERNQEKAAEKKEPITIAHPGGSGNAQADYEAAVSSGDLDAAADAVKRMKVPEIKERLKAARQKVSGKKAEIADRLIGHLKMKFAPPLVDEKKLGIQPDNAGSEPTPESSREPGGRVFDPEAAGEYLTRLIHTWSAENPSFGMPFDKIYQATKRHYPDMSIGQFHEVLRAAKKNGDFALSGWATTIDELPDAKVAMLLPRTVLYYAHLHSGPDRSLVDPGGLDAVRPKDSRSVATVHDHAKKGWANLDDTERAAVRRWAKDNADLVAMLREMQS